MRGPLDEDQDEEDPPTWGIWEYDIATRCLHRVIVSDTIASEGNDVAPALPSGRPHRVLLDAPAPVAGHPARRGQAGFEAQTDDGSESAFVLHVMNADGTDIHQISFNQSHDLAPSVLANGRVLFSRWDGAPGRGIHLYTSNPDGTDLQLLYGAHSHHTGIQIDARTIQFTRAARDAGRPHPHAGPPVHRHGLRRRPGDHRHPQLRREHAAAGRNAGMTGPAQTRATPNEVLTVEGPSPGGRFSSAFPLWDGTNRILVTWSQCRLLDTTVTPTPSCPARRTGSPIPNPVHRAAALQRVDVRSGREHLQAAVPAGGRRDDHGPGGRAAARAARVILDKVAGIDFDPDALDRRRRRARHPQRLRLRRHARSTGAGAPNIATLANPAQRTADQRPARFLRIEKAVSQADDDVGFDIDNAAFGARELHARDPRLRADRAGRLGVGPRAGERRLPSRCSTPTAGAVPAASQLAAGAAGRDARCNGCHQAGAGSGPGSSHGRDGTSTSAWPGAGHGRAVPEREARFSPDAGETMAQARARTSCVDRQQSARRCPASTSVYTDVWTEPTTAGRPRTPRSATPMAAPAAHHRRRRPVSAACTTLEQHLPHHHQLRAAHPAAVGCATRHARPR